MTDRPESGRIFLSVVVPAFNEEARIGQTLTSIRGYLLEKNFRSEIIVVDDGSRDRTAEEAGLALRGMAEVQIIRCPRNAGKGAALKEGILRARGDFVLFSDADLSTPIEELEKFWPLVDQGCDVVIGSRALPGADIQVRQSPIRELMGKTFNVFVRLLVLKGIRDTQCGFKLFRGETAREVFPLIRTRGFSFDVETLSLCRRLGHRIAQVPVVWRNAPQSRVRIVRSSARMFLDLLKIRRRVQRALPERKAP